MNTKSPTHRPASCFYSGYSWSFHSAFVQRSIEVALFAVALLSVADVHAANWTSSKTPYNGATGRLTYPADAEQNRIPDFSNAGYQGGGVPLPANVTVQKTIFSPSGGPDDTKLIQDAIDYVGAMPIQADGYRGTVWLKAGVYNILGTIFLNKDGVVLAGVGDGDSSSTNTILRRTGTSTAEVIIAGGGTGDRFETEWPNTRSDITQFVPVGSRSFTVRTPSLYKKGDNVVILHPSSSNWIAKVNAGDIEDPTFAWQPGDVDIRYHRYVTKVDPNTNTITVDAPVFNHLESADPTSVIYKYKGPSPGIVANVGIEDLQIDIVTASDPNSETHCQDAVQFIAAENSWIRDCTMKHFWHSGVQFNSSTRCTAERVRAIEPHSTIQGERRYNFSTYAAQLILFKDCFASEGRHSFVTNGASNDSGVVFLNCTIDNPVNIAEPHRRWSTGILYDGIVTTNRVVNGQCNTDTPPSGISGNMVLALHNRGNFGNHGWATGHSVIWNSKSAGGDIIVQKPPTAQNYAIGCIGNVTNVSWRTFTSGFIEKPNVTGLEPASLYQQQVAERFNYRAQNPDPTDPTPAVWLPALYKFEAESITRDGNGASSSVVSDPDANGDKWVSFAANGTGDFIDFTLPGVAAGTYQIKLHYKTHPNRGRHTLKANGTQIGGTLDQYAAAVSFTSFTFGNVTFANSGNQVIRLTVTGKNSASGSYAISADGITLTPVP